MIRRVGIAATSALAAGVIALVAAAPAFATPPNDDTPVSGDPRATAYSQHKFGNPTKCADVDSLKSAVDLKVGSTDDGTYLQITSVPEGFELKGVVVKGSDAFNVYLGDVRTDLHAPMTGKDNKNIAGISHWFACGVKKDTTPPTQPPGNNPPGNNPPGNNNPPADNNPGTGGTGNSPAAQGSNAAAVSDAALADTGVSTTVPLVIGGLLVLLGGGLLLAMRRRLFG